MYSEKLSIVKQSLGSYYESNDEMLFFCTKCNHHKRKLSVNINKNVFKCWICDFKGNDLYPIIKDRNLKQKWKELTQQVDITRFEEVFSNKQEIITQEAHLEPPEHFCTLTTPNLSPLGNKAKNYLLNRGVSAKEILMYKMGFCFHGPYKNRIIVHSNNTSGDLKYFIARSYGED